MRWLTLLLALSLLAGCDGGDDRSGDEEWELSGVWELGSDIECMSALLNDTQLDMVEVSLADDFGTFGVEHEGEMGRIYHLQSDFERTVTLSDDMFSYSYEGTLLDGRGSFEVFGTVQSNNEVEIREEILAASTNATLTCSYFMRKI
ncbi:MAG: hypothetical protein OXP66_15420 [Candidatus Tectomicrobia bacterium]|nr:hypothetical protein [Candidatus Tectomicrobia bacterium]